MRAHCVCTVLVVLGCSLLGCGSKPASRSEPSQWAADDLPGTPDARRIALGQPQGTTAADALIVELQGRAMRNPKQLDHWIALGRAWIRKAREAADPGYY